MLYKNVGTTLFRFVTNHAFDRQTDGRTDTFLVASLRWHSMQRGINWNKQVTRNLLTYTCVKNY